MSITINQPLVVAQVQELKIESVTVNLSQKFIEVKTVVLDEQGTVVREFIDRFDGAEANTLSQSCVKIKKKLLYEAITNKHGFEVAVPPMTDTIE